MHHIFSSHMIQSMGSILSFILITWNVTTAQAPQKMSYQSVVRDAGGALVTNSTVGVQISIIRDSTNGTVVYEETHSLTTNTNGLATLKIGTGTVVTGVFDTIEWSGGPYYLRTETDPDGGTNYTVSSTSQLMSVPYALYADRSGDTTSLDQAYDSGGKGLGRMITADSGAVWIKGTDGIQVSGIFGIGDSIDPGGTGPYLLFNPRKAAFRAGFVYGNRWNNEKVGIFSMAMGRNTTASGIASMAIGDFAIASGGRSTAMGETTKASGDRSTAMGISTTASGDRSTTMGSNTTASGYISTAMGEFSTASGNQSIAMGINATASGFTSTSMGFDTKASGIVSTAMGEFTTASGNRSTSMGYNSIASGNFSTAMGHSTEASGNYSTAKGRGTEASGDFSTAMGRGTEASGDRSTAMGDNTEASGDRSTAMGYATKASGDQSTAMGFDTKANGNRSTAMGWITTASGLNSTAMGLFTTASGNYSTAMGHGTEASGDFSTALGYDASTNGKAGSFVIGDHSVFSTNLISNKKDQFKARFDNGYTLFTSSDTSTGVFLENGDNAWSMLSDRNRKENFLPVDGEHILHKIGEMELTTWNFKGQDPATERHYGPMAQDFYKAFGRDALGTIGSDTRINTGDFMGINLIGIQALEHRTDQLDEENEKLKRTTRQLKKENDSLRMKIESLEAEVQNIKHLMSN